MLARLIKGEHPALYCSLSKGNSGSGRDCHRFQFVGEDKMMGPWRSAEESDQYGLLISEKHAPPQLPCRRTETHPEKQLHRVGFRLKGRKLGVKMVQKLKQQPSRSGSS